MFCDLPSTDKFTLTLFFALAEREALLVSIRTKQALQALKHKGMKLGAANETYRRNYDNLTIEERRLRQMRKGVLKRQRYHESKDFVTFKRILEKVFPEYTEAEDVKDWKWGYINMKRENREKVLELMKDYKDLDNTGQLFRKFDFENDMEFCDARIHQYLQRFRNSCIGTTKEV